LLLHGDNGRPFSFSFKIPFSEPNDNTALPVTFNIKAISKPHYVSTQSQPNNLRADSKSSEKNIHTHNFGTGGHQWIRWRA